MPGETLRRLIDAANQAPTASNAQNTRWIIVRDPEQKMKLADLNRAARQAAYGDRPPPANVRETRRRRASQWHTEHLQDVPAHIIACLELATPPEDSFIRGVACAASTGR